MSESNDSERPSKTKRKKHAHAQQALGARLANLRPDRLDGIPLQSTTREAIDEYRRLTGHEAQRRQMQRIGKLMRNENEADIQRALAKLEQATPQEQRLFRAAQDWRERVLADPDTQLTALLAVQPQLNAADLRALIMDHQRGDVSAKERLFALIHYALRA